LGITTAVADNKVSFWGNILH